MPCNTRVRTRVRVLRGSGVVVSSYRPTIMEPHYLSLLYHGCYLPSCKWVTSLFPVPAFPPCHSAYPVPLSRHPCFPCTRSLSPFHLLRAATVLLPVAVALSRYQPSFVARLEAVQLRYIFSDICGADAAVGPSPASVLGIAKRLPPPFLILRSASPRPTHCLRCSVAARPPALRSFFSLHVFRVYCPPPAPKLDHR